MQFYISKPTLGVIIGLSRTSDAVDPTIVVKKLKHKEQFKMASKLVIN